MGSIPLKCLSGSCKEYGFADIPTQVRPRLTNAYSYASSDHRCMIFGHDLMCSIDANNCNMRQHRKGISQSDNIVGGLAL